MHCTECNESLSLYEIYYDLEKYLPYCAVCKDDTKDHVNAMELDEKLDKALVKLKNGSLSTRLPFDELIYFLKFAQEMKTTSISQTFVEMVRELRKKRGLENVKLNGVPFDRKKRKKVIDPDFLSERKEKRVISIDDLETNDDDEGVIEI